MLGGWSAGREKGRCEQQLRQPRRKWRECHEHRTYRLSEEEGEQRRRHFRQHNPIARSRGWPQARHSSRPHSARARSARATASRNWGTAADAGSSKRRSAIGTRVVLIASQRISHSEDLVRARRRFRSGFRRSGSAHPPICTGPPPSDVPQVPQRVDLGEGETSGQPTNRKVLRRGVRRPCAVAWM